MCALLARCHNLGGTISSWVRALTLQRMGISPTGAKQEQHQFDHLWKASLLTSILSFGACCLLPFFIPKVRQTDTLLMGGTAKDPAYGSLWRRCLFFRFF
eukprot:g860.t1